VVSGKRVDQGGHPVERGVGDLAGREARFQRPQHGAGQQ
jgi:hypothetical protein